MLRYIPAWVAARRAGEPSVLPVIAVICRSWHAGHLLVRVPERMAEVGTGAATWLRDHIDMGLAVLFGRPAPWAQVCSLTGVMMSAAEKSVANCSGLPNIAAMRSVYLAR